MFRAFLLNKINIGVIPKLQMPTRQGIQPTPVWSFPLAQYNTIRMVRRGNKHADTHTDSTSCFVRHVFSLARNSVRRSCLIHSLSSAEHKTVRNILRLITILSSPYSFLFHYGSPYIQLLHKVLTHSFKFLFGSWSPLFVMDLRDAYMTNQEPDEEVWKLHRNAPGWFSVKTVRCRFRWRTMFGKKQMKQFW